MAATGSTSNALRHNQWYFPDLTEVNAPVRSLLESYSRIPSEEVVRHVNEIRAIAFKSNPYPCIGNFKFLVLTLTTHPLYPTILARLRADPGTRYLDLGCGFGQDLRQLVVDGVPSRQLMGLDVEPALIDLSWRLFRDQTRLESKFIVADLLADSSTTTHDDDEEDPLYPLLANPADVVHCSALIHLFPLPQQRVLVARLTRLVAVGGVVVGRQSGSVVPMEKPAITEGTTCFRHDVESFRQLWQDAGRETGTEWTVEGTLDMVGMKGMSTAIEDPNSRRLLFTVTRTA